MKYTKILALLFLSKLATFSIVTNVTAAENIIGSFETRYICHDASKSLNFKVIIPTIHPKLGDVIKKPNSAVFAHSGEKSYLATGYVLVHLPDGEVDTIKNRLLSVTGDDHYENFVWLSISLDTLKGTGGVFPDFESRIVSCSVEVHHDLQPEN